ncbi:hypothetical protein GP486_006457 [Trichoglossum hirsutum]|uniref:DUF6594 domain-containing protein n=1 Tax=Trichoglossum hirsutum TaxID=265104 RepID=A0A9P8IJ45_9PEZI|nr:hypothetical protein GP486_006457 [Trichoglossum hirsutum]
MSYQRTQHTIPVHSTKRYAAGFSDFAAYIASDAELAIYRRFDRLSARNLLYLQSELLELERAVDAFDEEDLREQQGPDIDEARVARRWEEFVELSGNREKEGKKMKIIKEVRRVMKEYHTDDLAPDLALLLQSQVLKLEDPDSRPLEAIKTFFSRNRPLLGNGHRLLDEADDLTALKPALGRDRVSRFLQDYCGWLFAVGLSSFAISISQRKGKQLAIQHGQSD